VQRLVVQAVSHLQAATAVMMKHSLSTSMVSHPVHAMPYMPLFVSAPAPLNRHKFKQLCVVQRSSEGSNNASQEEDTLYSWEVFLLNVEG